MTTFTDIAPGEWALAFNEGFYDGSDMPEWLERFATWGGGWEGFDAREIFGIYEVIEVKPKTFRANHHHRRHREGAELVRHHRSFVIQAFATEAAAVALRDKFHAIGVDTTTRVEHEMYRRIQKFADREKAKSVKKVHACLPGIFGTDGA